MERTAILRTSTPTPGFILSLFYPMLNKGLVLTADVFTEGLTKEISNKPILLLLSFWPHKLVLLNQLFLVRHKRDKEIQVNGL